MGEQLDTRARAHPHLPGGWQAGGVVEYLLVFPERDVAESVAEELRDDEEFAQVKVVREALAGEDDSEAHEWAVYVRVDTIDDESSAPARALTERFQTLAAEHEGWVDENVSPPAELD